MKIRQVHIERFGAWQDVALPLAPAGLTVLHGPNETGKSTLVRFIRGMLYGFEPQDGLGPGPRPRITACGGELLLTTDGLDLRVRRSTAAGGQAELLFGETRLEQPTPTLPRLLGGLHRDVYERVFAVGLGELQEMSTLHAEEVARFIYQTSLGSDGERLLTAIGRADDARRALTDSTHGAATVWQIVRRIAGIDAALAESRQAEERQTRLQQQSVELETKIADQRWRQRGLRDQLRGHLFLDRAFGPWQRQRKLQQELAALPAVGDFPDGGARLLSNHELELADLDRQAQRLRTERRNLRRDLSQLPAPGPLWRQRLEIDRLVKEHGELRSVESQLPTLKASVETARRKLDERIRQLGPGWSEARLERLCSEPAAVVRLFKLADRYRAAARSRSRSIRAYRSMSKHAQQRQAELSAAMRRYAGDGVGDARRQVEQELDDLDRVRQLEARHEAGLQTLQQLRRDAAARGDRPGHPRHFLPAIGLLGAAGACLAIAGFWQYFARGAVQSAIIGAIFALLAVCSGGLVWTIRQWFEQDSGDHARHEDRLRQAQRDLDGLEAEMRRLVERPVVLADEPFGEELRIAGCDGVDDASDADQIAERHATLTADLAALQRAELTEGDLRRDRERLGRLRQRIRLLQRSVSQARRDWCVALQDSGFDETLRVAGALELWQAAHEANAQRRTLHDAQAALRQAEPALRAFAARVAAVAAAIDGSAAEGGPAECLPRWQNDLRTITTATARRQELRSRLRALRIELRNIRGQRRVQSAARRTLLARVGARNRDDFLRLESVWRRRGELESLLDDATLELEEAAASEPDLAIVEDDLFQLDPPRNRAAIETIEHELADLEADLQSDHETLGRMQQELAVLAADRQSIELRYERAQAEHALNSALKQAAAAALAARALEAVRLQFEAEQQPQILRAAARYLHGLTAGRYLRVFAPLGERSLLIEDEQRRSFRVEQLSSGTREQLFLAIRLALIDDFVRQGIELPVVLDDLFVNFDQQRTEAAVRTIIDYAADGRQVLLLTCHQHLVRLFEAAGATAVRLPEPGNILDRRRVG